MNHRDYEPGSDCPGYLQHLKTLNRRRGVYPVWECTACGLTNDPAVRRQLESVWRHLSASGNLQQTEVHCPGVKSMKMKIGINRKAGAPGFGSDGAIAELEIDLDDEATPAQLLTQATTWYHTLEQAVDLQLARMNAKHPQPGAAVVPPPKVPPLPTEAGHEPPAPRRGDAYEEPEPQSYGPPPARPSRNGYGSSIGNQQPARSSGRDDPPRSAAELAGWMKTSGHKDAVVAWGRANNLPWQVKSWPDDAAAACYHDVTARAAAGQWGGRN